MRRAFIVMWFAVLLAGCRDPFAEVSVQITAKNESSEAVVAVVEGIEYATVPAKGGVNFTARVSVRRNPVPIGGGSSFGPSVVDIDTEVSVYFKVTSRNEVTPTTYCTAGAKIRLDITHYASGVTPRCVSKW